MSHGSRFVRNILFGLQSSKFILQHIYSLWGCATCMPTVEA